MILTKTAISKLGKRDLNFENHYNPNFKNLSKKPIVFAFGGNCTKDNKRANGYCKVVQNMLEDGKVDCNQVDIVGINYGVYKNEKGEETSTSFLTEGDIEYFATLFDKLFLDEAGNKLKKSDVLKNFNKINFFTHSYGAQAANQILHKVYETLVNYKYSYQDIDDFFSQITCVSYTPISEIFGTTHLLLCSGQDSFDLPNNASKKARNDYYHHVYMVQDEKEHGSNILKTDEHTAYLFTTNMFEKKDKDISNEFINKELNSGKLINDHQFQVFMQAREEYLSNSNQEAAKIYDILKSTLSNAVLKSIKTFETGKLNKKETIDDICRKTKEVLGDDYIKLNEDFQKSL